MVFWSTTGAAPSVADVLGLRGRHPRFLRLNVPSLSALGRLARRADMRDVDDICAFWSAYYGGDDWVFDATRDWVSKYLEDPTVYVLVMTNISVGLIATIVSTPVSTGKTLMSHGAELDDVRCIEGLCIHPGYRSQGLAGEMIAAMDWFTATIRPMVHLWSRELAAKPLFSTAVEISTYAYIDSQKARRLYPVSVMQWDEFMRYWTHMSSLKKLLRAYILGSVPSNRRGDLMVWTCGERLAVISRTRRRMRGSGRDIYEVVWCNQFISEGSYEYFLESVAVEYDGLLFASSTRMGGGASRDWDPPWVVGRSGVHAWYIYNYIPPSFGACELHIVREEI